MSFGDDEFLFFDKYLEMFSSIDGVVFIKFRYIIRWKI